MKLSIIVPVYKVEAYIERCIRSLLLSDFPDYEIIIIDDGTPDDSIGVVERSFEDSRIKILHRKNGGLSAARNTGLSAAIGEYVWFFDSDDWAEISDMNQLISQLKDIDVLSFNSYYINYDATGKQVVTDNHINADTGRDLCCYDYYFPVQFYIYRRAFLEDNNFSFKEGIIHEDSLFSPIVLSRANKVKCYKQPVYHYRQREDSIMSAAVKPKSVYNLITVIEELLQYGKTLDYDYKYKWGKCMARIINSLLYRSKKCNDKEAKKFTKELVNKNREIISYLKHSGRNNRLMAVMSEFFCGNLIFVYNILYAVRYRK